MAMKHVSEIIDRDCEEHAPVRWHFLPWCRNESVVPWHVGGEVSRPMCTALDSSSTHAQCMLGAIMLRQREPSGAFT